VSLPSSTGEEPYLDGDGAARRWRPANAFRVDAWTSTHAASRKVVKAVYGRNSFRATRLGSATALRCDGGGIRLRENVRQQVRFQQGNLLAPDLLTGVAAYDVIFCRTSSFTSTARRRIGRSSCEAPAAMTKDVVRRAGGNRLPREFHDLVSTNERLAFAFRRPMCVARRQT